MQTAAFQMPPLPVHAARNEPKKPEGANPRTRRFGINPGVYNMTVSTLASGLPEKIIPPGKLLLFETWDPVRPNFEGVLGLNKSPAQVRVEKTAETFITNVKIRCGGKGFTELAPLTPLTDDEARFAFYSVFVPIEDCPFGLAECVTCRMTQLGHLDINAVPTSATIRNEQGQMEAVSVDREVFRSLRQILLSGYTKFHTWVMANYEGKLSEIEGRANGEAQGMTKLKAAEHNYRKQLHRQEPRDKQQEVAARLGEAQAKETRAGFAAITEGLTNLLTRQKEADPVQAKQLEVLAKISDKLAQSDEKPVEKPEAEPVRRGPGRPPANKPDGD